MGKFRNNFKLFKYLKEKARKIKMPNKSLLKFIREARKKGFSDLQIKEPLLKHGWPLDEIEAAFYNLKPKYKFKNKINIFLDNEILKILEKRAKRNMLTISEQIEDILRRSSVGMKRRKLPYDKKLDDILISIFSREKRGRKTK